MTPEEKAAQEAAVLKAKAEAQEAVKKMAEEAAKTTVEENQKAVNEKLEAIEKAMAEGVKTKEDIAALNKNIAEMQARVKAISQTEKSNGKAKSFNQFLAEAIEENAEAIKSHSKGKEVNIVMKEVGDMSLAANFPNAGALIQDQQTGLIATPYERLSIADLLPRATSTANSVVYPKENGGEGAVAFWDKSGNKAQVDYDFTSQVAASKWLAGIVVVDREMLDDIPWLTGYLQSKLLAGLKKAENSLILDGTADSTNPVTGLLAAATAYDGDYTVLAEQIVDAAYGQIPEKTFDFYRPTNAVLHPRDIVKVALNKATGSGEFDLPPGSISFANGQLNIAGLQTTSTTDVDKDDFLVFDKAATMFISRMAPEIRMYDDSELAKVNKVMFRIESRASLAIFNNNAIVKGVEEEGGEG